jgi:hypothetical protein
MAVDGIDLGEHPWYWHVQGPRTALYWNKMQPADEKSGTNVLFRIEFNADKSLPKKGSFGGLCTTGELWRGTVTEAIYPRPPGHAAVDVTTLGEIYAQLHPGAVSAAPCTLLTMLQANYWWSDSMPPDETLTIYNGVAVPERSITDEVFAGVGVCNAQRWWLTFTLSKDPIPPQTLP